MLSTYVLDALEIPEYRVKGVVIYYHIIALTAIPLLAIMAAKNYKYRVGF